MLQRVVAQWVKPALRVCQGRGIKNSALWYDELLGLRTAAQCSKAASGSALRREEAELGVTQGRGAASPGCESGMCRVNAMMEPGDGSGGRPSARVNCPGEQPRPYGLGYTYPSSRAMMFVNLL